MVHPHVRGAYASSAGTPASSNGSSPRAWGLLNISLFHPPNNRFIPTCVGLTQQHLRIRHPSAVHPHVRGAYFDEHKAGRPVDGSSPRAWGLPIQADERVHDHRFIPTCVGLTRSGPYRPSRWSVHPHVRGAYVSVPDPLSPGNGSSPRAWGLRPG